MFSKFISFIILAAVIIFPSAYCYSEAYDHPLTLSELVSIALENHPSTRKAWWNANRAASALGSAESPYYPQVAVSANAMHGRTFKFVNGPDTTYNIVGAELSLGMLLFDFGDRKAGVNMAKMALLSANWQTDWIIQKVMVNVLQNAYAVLHAQETLQAAISAYEDAANLLNVAVELNKAGATPVSDVYTSKASLAQAKMELSIQRGTLDVHKGKLASSLGLPATVVFTLQKLDPIQAQQLCQTEDLMALACQQRADLMARQARLQESLYNRDRAKAAYGPRVSFLANGGPNYAFHDREHGAQYMLALSIDMPLFTGFDTMYKNRVAYADPQISMEELADLQLEIYLEVLTHNRTLEAAQEMLPDADNNLENAQKAYESTLQRYQAGIERIAEVSIAQRQLAAARVRYSDVKTRWFVSMANLAYATGTLGPYMETSCNEQN